MWALLAPILNSVFGQAFTSFVDAYKAKLAAENNADQIAATLAARELEVQQREIEVTAQLKTAEIGKWYEPDHLFGYIMVIYFGKVVLWDKVLGSITHGNTDAITGAAAEWAGMIMGFYVGLRGIQNVARIIKR